MFSAMKLTKILFYLQLEKISMLMPLLILLCYWSIRVESGCITVLVNFQAILLMFSGETSSNRDIFFTEDAAKQFFPTSKMLAQEIRHQFFLIWSNLTIMAHMMGLENQSESWKIIILS